jgi:hypothetical protein
MTCHHLSRKHKKECLFVLREDKKWGTKKDERESETEEKHKSLWILFNLIGGAGNLHYRKRLSTTGLHVLTSLDSLLFQLETCFSYLLY